jgi:hypothetical protein
MLTAPVIHNEQNNGGMNPFRFASGQDRIPPYNLVRIAVDVHVGRGPGLTAPLFHNEKITAG